MSNKTAKVVEPLVALKPRTKLATSTRSCSCSVESNDETRQEEEKASRPTCSICLDTLGRNGFPTTLRCGHSFCIRCIMGVLSWQCPICREDFSMCIPLRKNLALASVLATKERVEPDKSCLWNCKQGEGTERHNYLCKDCFSLYRARMTKEQVKKCRDDQANFERGNTEQSEEHRSILDAWGELGLRSNHPNNDPNGEHTIDNPLANNNQGFALHPSEMWQEDVFHGRNPFLHDFMPHPSSFDQSRTPPLYCPVMDHRRRHYRSTPQNSPGSFLPPPRYHARMPATDDNSFVHSGVHYNYTGYTTSLPYYTTRIAPVHPSMTIVPVRYQTQFVRDGSQEQFPSAPRRPVSSAVNSSDEHNWQSWRAFENVPHPYNVAPPGAWVPVATQRHSGREYDLAPPNVQHHRGNPMATTQPRRDNMRPGDAPRPMLNNAHVTNRVSNPASRNMSHTTLSPPGSARSEIRPRAAPLNRMSANPDDASQSPTLPQNRTTSSRTNWPAQNSWRQNSDTRARSARYRPRENQGRSTNGKYRRRRSNPNPNL